jgi:molybdenum cofactor cytidylyltransferase
MKFGLRPTRETAGTILAHSVRLDPGTIKKGTRLSPADVDRIMAAGIDEIVVATLDPGDVLEDETATRLAAAIAGPGIDAAPAATGRVNLYAAAAGLLEFDRASLIALNRIDEGITVATLPHHARVEEGRMVATIKIIPYAVPAASLKKALAAIQAAAPFISFHPFKPHRAGLILGRAPETKSKLVEKREAITRTRVEELGSTLEKTEVVDQEVPAVAAAITRAAEAGLDPILVFGASAIVDRGDVIPAAIEAAGGQVHHFGMPVDPGNLLLVGSLDGRSVIGVPSCASSPKLNGLDWVLERTLAGLPTTSADLAEMAPGGLLMEITSRPQPREATGDTAGSARPPRIAGLILAAGRSTRMGALNKLTEEIAGKPMVRHVADAAAAAGLAGLYVVTGNAPEAVRAALDGIAFEEIPNPDFRNGLATSLAAGVRRLMQEDDLDGAIILLGDMPLVTAGLITRLIAAFAPSEGHAICVPVLDGKRGNPILWSARFFPDMAGIQGDTGAKHLLGENAEWIAEVPVDDPAIFRDIDTPAALAALRGED